jgi:hypothetical protein
MMFFAARYFAATAGALAGLRGSISGNCATL